MELAVPAAFTRKENVDHVGNSLPIPSDKKFSYGTAGFRDAEKNLPFIAFRVGCIAALRARQLGKCIGVMLTASHNPEGDNGVKVVDPLGEMLAPEWEILATELVNCSDEQLGTKVEEIASKYPACSGGTVMCGRDTRKSGEHLTNAVRKAVEALAMKIEFVNVGVLTTPKLHYLVRVRNDPSFAAPGETYNQRLVTAFGQLFQMHKSTSDSHYVPVVGVDCANGVGAMAAVELAAELPADTLRLHMYNQSGPLNHLCGADYVKIKQSSPEGWTHDGKSAALDGDADRLIYFRPKSDGSAVLLDGDRIACLYAKFFAEQLSEAGLSSQLTMGIVQTAYANGNSTNYIRDVLGLSPVIVPTGVKHLHHAAQDFDVGIYFEANGHGTVCFSQKFNKLVRDNVNTDSLPLKRLKLMSVLINEVVGDALADLLAAEAMLHLYGWSHSDWETKLYTDAPSMQIKIPVADRSLFKTTWEETTLLAPEGLQKAVDALVAAQKKPSRAFVRPSGTENIVRVYAEAPSEEETKELAEKVADSVRAI